MPIIDKWWSIMIFELDIFHVIIAIVITFL